MPESGSRREFLLRTGVVCGIGMGPVLASVPLFGEDKKQEKGDEEISPSEDLMREHGVLNRILLIYEEHLRRLDAKQDFDPQLLSAAAAIVCQFVEDYHEKLEETYIFPEFEKKKWAQANGYASTGSTIAANVLTGDEIGFQFRGPGEVTLGSNLLVGVTTDILDDTNYFIRHNKRMRSYPPDPRAITVLGTSHPVGARDQLRGRQNIIMTEWGPWDHLSPLKPKTGPGIVQPARPEP